MGMVTGGNATKATLDHFLELRNQFTAENTKGLNKLLQQVKISNWIEFQKEREPLRIFPQETFFYKKKAFINFELFEKFTKKHWSDNVILKPWCDIILRGKPPNYNQACMQTWTLPPGILESCNENALKYKMHIKDGKFWFPTDYRGTEDPRCCFKRTKLDSPFLINPPYESNQLEPLLEHIQKLSSNNRTSLVLVLPYRPETTWFQHYVIQHPNNTFIKFQRNLIFLHNNEGVLGAFKEKSILLFTNVMGKPIKVDNNCAGNFNLTLDQLKHWTWRFQQKLELKDHVFDKFIDKITGELLSAAEIRKENYLPYDLGVELKNLRSLPSNITDNNFHPEELINKPDTPYYFVKRLKRFNNNNATLYETISTAKENFANRIKHLNETCTLCQSGNHSSKACLLADYDASHLQDEDEKTVILFLRSLVSENGLAQLKNGTKLLTRSKDKGSHSNFLKHLRDNAKKRSDEFMSALKKVANWTIKPDYHFSLIRWKISMWYGYGVPKNHLLRIFGGWRLIPSLENKSRIITSGDHPQSEKSLKLLDETVKTRVIQGRLVPIPFSLVHGGCVEFPVEQHEKIRPITDASGINPLYKPDPIVYPTVSEVLMNFDKNIVAAIDLSKAYHQMPIAWTDLQKFCIKHREKWFLQTGMPQGFSRAPEMFTNFLKPLQRIFRVMGFRSAILIDDIFLALGTSDLNEIEVEIRMRAAINLMEDLGLIMNSKTQIYAQAEATYLGKRVNTAVGKQFPTLQKLQTLSERAKKLLIKHSKKDSASFLGLAEFINPGNSICTRSLQKTIYDDFKLGKNPTKKAFQLFYNKISHLTGGCLEDLVLTFESIFNEHNDLEKVRKEPRTILLHGDASDEGCGFFITFNGKSELFMENGDDSQTIHHWEKFSGENSILGADIITSSTYRETLGILRAFEFIQKYHLKNSFDRIDIFTDNSALAVIGRTLRAQHEPTQNLVHKIKRYNRWATRFFWHRRSRPTAQIADFLSKQQLIKIQHPLSILIWKQWHRRIGRIISDKTWIQNTWKLSPVCKDLKSLLNNINTLIIVPSSLLNSKISPFIEFLKIHSFQGMLCIINAQRSQAVQYIAKDRKIKGRIHINSRDYLYYFKELQISKKKRLPRLLVTWSSTSSR